MTLEWILIFGAIAGLAASTTLIVQRVVDDTSELPADPAVRVIDADIEAAFLAAEADEAALSGMLEAQILSEFGPRCASIETAFQDVVLSASWTSAPSTIPANPPTQPLPTLDDHAECTVDLRQDLGG